MKTIAWLVSGCAPLCYKELQTPGPCHLSKTKKGRCCSIPTKPLPNEKLYWLISRLALPIQR